MPTSIKGSPSPVHRRQLAPGNVYFETYPIRGASGTDIKGVRQPDPSDIAGRITEVYTSVARYSGKIVGSHNLRCDEQVTGPEGDPIPTQTEYLFVVAKLPIR